MAADARLSLSADQIDRFVHDGVLVVDNVLSPDEVSDARQRFHACLQQHGVVCACMLSNFQVMLGC